MNTAEVTLPKRDPSTLFDEHGRCLPAKLANPAHPRTRRYFHIAQPKVDYGDIHARSQKYLGVPDGVISVEEFAQRAERILQNLRNDPATKRITDGAGVPFLLPKASYTDYGEALEKNYLKAVAATFADKFPKYDFVNHYKGELAGKLGIISESRHDHLVEAMQRDLVVGYYFPCLSEYAVPAAIEQVAQLPEQFMLAGGFDTCAALVGTPNLLHRADGYPPLLWLAALSGEKADAGFYFEAYGYNLTFNRRPHFNQVAEYWSSGLVVLG